MVSEHVFIYNIDIICTLPHTHTHKPEEERFNLRRGCVFMMLSQQVCLYDDEVPFTHTHKHVKRSDYTHAQKRTHKHTYTLADQAHTQTHVYTC